MLKIKNWHKFQHFKDRKPPWIKLYRDILDDKQWFRLPENAKSLLVQLWLLASEDKGMLPDLDTIAFRLRTTEQKLKPLINSLSHWLEQDDIEAISEQYQVDAPETERETEKETEKSAHSIEAEKAFGEFWQLYPKKMGKVVALRAWQRVPVTPEIWRSVIRPSLERQRKLPDWLKDGGQYVPYPATWINGRRWEDVVQVRNDPKDDPLWAEKMAAAQQKLRELAERNFEKAQAIKTGG